MIPGSSQSRWAKAFAASSRTDDVLGVVDHLDLGSADPNRLRRGDSPDPRQDVVDKQDGGSPLAVVATQHHRPLGSVALRRSENRPPIGHRPSQGFRPAVEQRGGSRRAPRASRARPTPGRLARRSGGSRRCLRRRGQPRARWRRATRPRPPRFPARDPVRRGTGGSALSHRRESSSARGCIEHIFSVQSYIPLGIGTVNSRRAELFRGTRGAGPSAPGGGHRSSPTPTCRAHERRTERTSQ